MGFFQKIINAPLGLFGLKLVRKSRLQKLQQDQEVLLSFGPHPRSDIYSDKKFMSIYERVKPFTMVELERCYALYQAVQYITRNEIKGDLVECGVWKGGSIMVVLFTLLAEGIADRDIWLYDTFEGMAMPGAEDGNFEMEEWNRLKTVEGSSWCYASLEEVEENLQTTKYPLDRIHLIRGRVEETIPHRIPSSIALLRLDTDWYSSTKHELEHLYPLMVQGAALIIDDYGSWQGARRATDEYFKKENVFFNRIDWTGRLLLKK